MANPKVDNYVIQKEKWLTRKQLDQAKKRLLEKCRGKLSITPIETTNVECIIDLFLKELR